MQQLHKGKRSDRKLQPENKMNYQHKHFHYALQNNINFAVKHYKRREWKRVIF